jgi:hypothetical protein
MIQSLIQLFVNILKLRYKKTLSNALARVQKYRFSIAKILFFKPNETLLMFASPNSICMPHSTLIERITATPYRDLDSNCRRKKTPITEQANSIILQHPRSIFHVSARSPFSFARCAFTYTHTHTIPTRDEIDKHKQSKKKTKKCKSALCMFARTIKSGSNIYYLVREFGANTKMILRRFRHVCCCCWKKADESGALLTCDLVLWNIERETEREDLCTLSLRIILLPCTTIATTTFVLFMPHTRVKFFFCRAPSFTFRPRRRSERRERMLSNKHTDRSTHLFTAVCFAVAMGRSFLCRCG